MTAGAIANGAGVAIAYILTFQSIYYLTVLRGTSDAKLQDARG